jgi:hypothetical protein
MLIFKKNIYEPTSHPEHTLNQGLDPYDFIFHSLMTDREIFFGLNQLPEGEAKRLPSNLYFRQFTRHL